MQIATVSIMKQKFIAVGNTEPEVGAVVNSLLLNNIKWCRSIRLRGISHSIVRVDKTRLIINLL